MQKLLVCILFVLFGSQASAWVSKEFIPSNVSLITVNIDDQANDGCWTNIGEVKRYTEDKLELAGFKVSRNKFKNYIDNRHFILNIHVNATRGVSTCFGDIRFGIIKSILNNNMYGMFIVGEYGSNFTGSQNANAYILELISGFIKEVEDPQW